MTPEELQDRMAEVLTGWERLGEPTATAHQTIAGLPAIRYEAVMETAPDGAVVIVGHTVGYGVSYWPANCAEASTYEVFDTWEQVAERLAEIKKQAEGEK